MGHAAVAVEGLVVLEPPGSLDPDGGRGRLPVTRHVDQALGGQDRMQRLLEASPRGEEPGHDGQIAPARGVEQLHVVIAERDLRRRHRLVGAQEGVEDPEQLGHVVGQVDLREGLHHFLLAGQGEGDRERSSVGRAHHDEAPASTLAVGVLHRVPHVGEELDETAGDQAAQRVDHEVYRLALGPAFDHLAKRGRGLVHVAPPVVGEGHHLPALHQLQQEGHVGAGVHAIGDDRGRRRKGAAVVGQAQLGDPAGQDAEGVEPDAVFVSLLVERVELGAHEARQHDHPALGGGAPTPAGAAIQALQPLVAHPHLQQLALVRVEREEGIARALCISGGQCLVEPAQALPLAAHRALRVLPFAFGTFSVLQASRTPGTPRIQVLKRSTRT